MTGSKRNVSPVGVRNSIPFGSFVKVETDCSWVRNSASDENCGQAIRVEINGPIVMVPSVSLNDT